MNDYPSQKVRALNRRRSAGVDLLLSLDRWIRRFLYPSSRMCTALFLSWFLQIMSDIFAVTLPCLSFFSCLQPQKSFQFCDNKLEQKKHVIQIKPLVLYMFNCILQKMHQNFISGRVLPPSAQRLDWGVSSLSLAFSFSALNRGRVGNILYFAKGQIRCTCLCLKNMCANMRQHLD